jgi:hypothetical protein
MRGADAAAGFAVEVFVEENVIPEMRIVLHLFGVIASPARISENFPIAIINRVVKREMMILRADADDN